MLGEVLGGISYVYDLWAQLKVSIGRRREALVVSMVDGPIDVVMPSNASQYL